jgi:hypothetical protein
MKQLSLFSLFLSTTGKMKQSVPSPEKDYSGRIMKRILRPYPPFTDLGFDQLAKKITLNGHPTLDDITSDEYIAHFGRPMYVFLHAVPDYALLNIGSKVWCSV